NAAPSDGLAVTVVPAVERSRPSGRRRVAVEEVSRPTSSGPAVESHAVQSRAVPSLSRESAVEADPRHVLDRVTWASLTGPHARFAERNGRAIRYHPE